MWPCQSVLTLTLTLTLPALPASCTAPPVTCAHTPIVPPAPSPVTPSPPQALRDEKDSIEAEITKLASAASKDLGLVLDKTLKLEWHKAANSRTRCLRITQKEEKVVRAKLHAR